MTREILIARNFDSRHGWKFVMIPLDTEKRFELIRFSVSYQFCKVEKFVMLPAIQAFISNSAAKLRMVRINLSEN